jgi:hypothetical protein
LADVGEYKKRDGKIIVGEMRERVTVLEKLVKDLQEENIALREKEEAT